MRNTYKLIAIFILGWPLIMNCKKEVRLMSTATIIGEDYRIGMCEESVCIKIDGHPNPNDTSNGYFDIGTIPLFQYDGAYPIHVKISWTLSPKCFGNYVDISELKAIP